MNEISESRLRIALRCLIGAGAADRELLVCPQWQKCVTDLCQMLNNPDELKSSDAYALARGPAKQTVNPAWQNLEKVK